MTLPDLTRAMAFAARVSLVRSRARASEMTRAVRGRSAYASGRDPDELPLAQRLVHAMRFFDAYSGLPVKPPGRYGFGQGIVKSVKPLIRRSEDVMSPG